MGRPSKRTEATEAAILTALREGRTKREAARLGSIGMATLNEWERAIPAFAEAVKDAVEVAKNELLDIIKAAAKPREKGPGQWQAAAWLLERRWPTEFARTDRVEVTFDARKEAERMADELGLSVDEVLAEAEAVIAGHR